MSSKKRVLTLEHAAILHPLQFSIDTVTTDGDAQHFVEVAHNTVVTVPHKQQKQQKQASDNGSSSANNYINDNLPVVATASCKELLPFTVSQFFDTTNFASSSSTIDFSKLMHFVANSTPLTREQIDADYGYSNGDFKFNRTVTGKLDNTSDHEHLQVYQYVSVKLLQCNNNNNNYWDHFEMLGSEALVIVKFNGETLLQVFNKQLFKESMKEYYEQNTSDDDNGNVVSNGDDDEDDENDNYQYDSEFDKKFATKFDALVIALQPTIDNRIPHHPFVKCLRQFVTSHLTALLPLSSSSSSSPLNEQESYKYKQRYTFDVYVKLVLEQLNASVLFDALFDFRRYYSEQFKQLGNQQLLQQQQNKQQVLVKVSNHSEFVSYFDQQQGNKNQQEQMLALNYYPFTCSDHDIITSDSISGGNDNVPLTYWFLVNNHNKNTTNSAEAVKPLFAIAQSIGKPSFSSVGFACSEFGMFTTAVTPSSASNAKSNNDSSNTSSFIKSNDTIKLLQSMFMNSYSTSTNSISIGIPMTQSDSSISETSTSSACFKFILDQSVAQNVRRRNNSYTKIKNNATGNPSEHVAKHPPMNQQEMMKIKEVLYGIGERLVSQSATNRSTLSSQESTLIKTMNNKYLWKYLASVTGYTLLNTYATLLDYIDVRISYEDAKGMELFFEHPEEQQFKSKLLVQCSALQSYEDVVIITTK